MADHITKFNGLLIRSKVGMHQPKAPIKSRRCRAFTLIELLVVIAIIALLMAILVPVLRSARNQARAVVCQANLKQWGTTLNLYTEDNRGCFPCYDIYRNNESNIAWFLRGSIPGSDDQKDESLRPVEARGIACCPMAVGRRRTGNLRIFHNNRRVEGGYGKTFDAWEIISPGRPFRGSYGFNGWLFCQDFDASIPMLTRLTTMTGVRIDHLRGKGNIPVLLDSTTPYSHPDWRVPPPRKECVGIFGGSLFDMEYLAINRHNEHINGLFLDWSVRKIGIKELWTLKWHMQFNTANEWTKAGGVQPEDWPEWMRGFKDY